MKPQMERMLQVAYAERQFEVFKMKALLAHVAASTDAMNASHHCKVMGNWIGQMADCNDTLDRLRRELVENE